MVCPWVLACLGFWHAIFEVALFAMRNGPPSSDQKVNRHGFEPS
jgi:hypothetical protein